MNKFLKLATLPFLFVLVIAISGRVDMKGIVEAAPLDTAVTDHLIYLPMVNNQYNPQFPAPLFGMQMYGSTQPSSNFYNDLVDSRASWIRALVRWAVVEPSNSTPSSYIWTEPDNNLAAALPANGGFKVIATIDVLPEWARFSPTSISGRIKQDALDDFADFVYATVERYDGDGIADAPGQPVIRHWELFNEPDLDTRWGPYGAEYAAMLQIAYTAIKSADPQAQVLLGGLAYDFFDYYGGPFVSTFFDDVLAAGGGNYFDIMNIHMYPLFAPSWGNDMTGIPGKAADVRAKLAHYGLEKPVVLTETGWHSSVDGSSNHQEQIVLLTQLVTHSFAADIRVLIWFMLWDPGNFLYDYGLVTNASPPVRKPVFVAYQTAVSMLQNARYVANVSPPATGIPFLEAHQFQTPTGRLYVAWMSPYETNNLGALPISAKQVTVTSIDTTGVKQVTITDSNSDGVIHVTVSDNPVYIQVTIP